MGPTALFDKSFLHGISIDESVWFDHFFTVNVCPIFYAETQADLAKDCGDKTPADYVQVIASKFPDSGAPSSHHVRICATNLMGESVPFTPQIILPAGGEGLISGRRIGVLPESPESKAFLRWTTGDFQDEERAFARQWREMASTNISSQLIDRLTSEGTFRDRKISSLEDVRTAADEVMDRLGPLGQLVYAMSLIHTHETLHDRIIERFDNAGRPDIRTFAPYAAFCLRIELFFHIAVYKSRIGPSSKLDITYLFYLPFCSFFVSNDWVHKECSPLFVRPEQEFVYGPDLKASLAALDTRYSAMPDAHKKSIYEIATQPPRDDDGLVTQLWDRHWPKWREPREEKPTASKSYDWLMNQGDALDTISKVGTKTGSDSIRMPDAICRPYAVRVKKGKWWQVPESLRPRKE
jgi:hypothetical protein